MDQTEITLRPLTDEDIPLLAEWLDKEYIRKWFKEKEPWLNEIGERGGKYRFMTHFIVCHNDRRITPLCTKTSRKRTTPTRSAT